MFFQAMLQGYTEIYGQNQALIAWVRRQTAWPESTCSKPARKPKCAVHVCAMAEPFRTNEIRFGGILLRPYGSFDLDRDCTSSRKAEQ